jgi:hypothetical protein
MRFLFTPQSPQRSLHLLLLHVMAIRIALAAWIPITGDEAYFIQWGHFPDYGFYDHPPMVGWWLWTMLQISDHPLILRLPQVLLPIVVAVLMARLLRDRGDDLGYLAAIAWLVLPAQVLNIAVTTDTPLLLFSFASLAFFYVGIRNGNRSAYALSGAMLGLAFLSKYFAVLLGLAYLVFVLLSPKREKRWFDLAIVYACAAPFVALNLWWNYQHCWANLLFNLYNRHEDAGFEPGRPVLFLGLLLFVAGPFIWWRFLHARDLARRLCESADVRFLWLAAMVPLGVFALLSPVKSIGLHWLFAFVPALILAAALLYGRVLLVRTALAMGAASCFLLGGVIWALAQPIEKWQSLNAYDGIVQTFRAGEVFAALREYEGKYHFATDGYSASVTLSYNAQRQGFVASPGASGPRAGYFFVFGKADSHARHDDVLTDLGALDRQDILILTKTEREAKRFLAYFESASLRELNVRGAGYFLVVGRGFNFAKYRAEVVEESLRLYYRIPAYLPQGGCYFCERYLAQPFCPAD